VAGSLFYRKLVNVNLLMASDPYMIFMDISFVQIQQIHGFFCHQLDGRPMSGDIGRGATREALAFAVRLVAAEDRPPGL